MRSIRRLGEFPRRFRLGCRGHARGITVSWWNKEQRGYVMIQVESLTKRYGFRTAVQDVTFEVQ
ncbi:MAG TPA: hypothetical protein P5300_07530, partial [Acidobacteriota bacterium]|nr:hypothetical protein [Acidobacteriota bacterium]